MGIDDRRLRDALDVPMPAFEPREGFRKAAVVLPWFTTEGRDWLLFTRRRDDLRHHAGQISFPGGARDGDETPVQCALRETHEEVGIPPEAVDVLGGLPPRISVAGFLVHAVVARIPHDVPRIPDPGEVAAVVEFPVDELRDPDRWVMRKPNVAAARRESMHFERDGEVLWGMTAQLTLDLLKRLD